MIPRCKSKLLTVLSFGMMTAISFGQFTASLQPGGQKPAPSRASHRLAIHPSHVLVAFRHPVDATFAAGFGLQLAHGTQSRYFTCFDVMPGQTVDNAIDMLRRSPAVRWAEPDFLVTLNQAAPNDTFFYEQWGLQNGGQFGGVAKMDINAMGAWKVSKGDPSVRVAVIDSGVDLDHPDLVGKFYKAGTAVVGYDFVDDDADPSDTNGHGTAVAGVIAAAYGNGMGVAGLAPKAKIMPIRFCASRNDGLVSNAVQAIDFARERGATIINASWSFDAYSSILAEAVGRATASGITVVASAGNDGRNVDKQPTFPADLSRVSNGVISVGGFDRNGNVWNLSNFGRGIDVYAPALTIVSPNHVGGYGYFDGTSLASAYTAAVAALVKSVFPAATPAEVKARIVGGAVRSSGFGGYGAGRLSAANALEHDTTPPDPVTNLMATYRSSTAIEYHLTASGDDGMTGNLAYLDVRTSYKPINAINFQTAQRASVVPANLVPGSDVRVVLTGLTASGNRVVYMGVKAVDNVGNTSSLVTGPPVTLKYHRLLDNAESTLNFEGWTRSNDEVATGTLSWSDSPNANYAFNTNLSLTQTSSVVAAGPLVVHFNLKLAVEPNYDGLFVEASRNGGGTWTLVRRYDGFFDWRPQSLVIRSLPGESVKVRFRLQTDSAANYDGAHIDDIRLADGRIVNLDDVEAGSNFNVLGTFAITTLDASSPSHSWTDSPSGTYPKNADTQITAKLATNGTSLLPAFLSVNAKSDLEAGYDRTTVLISENSGTFKPVGVITGQFDWSNMTFDITQTSRKVRPRFRMTSDNSYEFDGVFLDDFCMFGEPAAPVQH